MNYIVRETAFVSESIISAPLLLIDTLCARAKGDFCLVLCKCASESAHQERLLYCVLVLTQIHFYRIAVDGL